MHENASFISPKLSSLEKKTDYSSFRKIGFDGYDLDRVRVQLSVSSGKRCVVVPNTFSR